jgi:hypothetical protein
MTRSQSECSQPGAALEDIWEDAILDSLTITVPALSILLLAQVFVAVLSVDKQYQKVDWVPVRNQVGTS